MNKSRILWGQIPRFLMAANDVVEGAVISSSPIKEIVALSIKANYGSKTIVHKSFALKSVLLLSGAVEYIYWAD